MQLLRIKSFVIITVLIATLFMGCILQKTTCIKIFDNNTITELGDCDKLDTTVLFFNIESDLVPTFPYLLQEEYVYVDDQALKMLMDYFSERDLLVLNAFKRIRKIGLLNIILLPNLYIDELYKQEIIPYLFFPSEDQKTLYIKNPFNGDDIDVTDVDYIKFKGTYLLPVPSL